VVTVSAHDDEFEAVGEPTYRPPLVAGGAAIAGAVLAAVTLATVSLLPFGVAGIGAWLLVIALIRGTGWLATLSSALVVVGILFAGVLGAPPLPMIVGAVGIAVAYDGSHYAIRLGTQLKRDADTSEAELAHVGATFAAAGGAGFVGYVVFELGAGGQPSTALVALLLAAVLLVWGLQAAD
jgi:hypothetical protein